MINYDSKLWTWRKSYTTKHSTHAHYCANYTQADISKMIIPTIADYNAHKDAIVARLSWLLMQKKLSLWQEKYSYNVTVILTQDVSWDSRIIFIVMVIIIWRLEKKSIEVSWINWQDIRQNRTHLIPVATLQTKITWNTYHTHCSQCSQ